MTRATEAPGAQPPTRPPSIYPAVWQNMDPRTQRLVADTLGDELVGPDGW